MVVFCFIVFVLLLIKIFSSHPFLFQKMEIEDSKHGVADRASSRLLVHCQSPSGAVREKIFSTPHTVFRLGRQAITVLAVS